MAITPQGDYFDLYTKNVSETNLRQAFDAQQDLLSAFLSAISEEKSKYAYAPGKWTLKEILQHLIDCERIFTFRALAAGRGDMTNLPGFDENAYADNSHANARTWESLCLEMMALRRATVIFFETLDPAMIKTTGLFNGKSGSAERIGFIILGHCYHHIRVAEERYLDQLKVPIPINNKAT